MKCECCETNLTYRWTDTHGIGACTNCGLPYTILFYENDKRIEKSPEHALHPEGLVLAKEYWAEKKMRVFPGVYDMGILGGRSSTYSGATKNEICEFNNWYKTKVKQVEDEQATNV